MSRTRAVYIYVFGLIFLILLATAIYYFINLRISADSLYGTEMGKTSKNLNIDSIVGDETVSVVRYVKDYKNNFVLTVVGNNGKKYYQSLAGFENEVNFCKNNELISIGQSKLICLRGYVGVHSENIQLVTFDGKSIKFINYIIENFPQDRITSDAPNFGFKDVNKDDLFEMYVDNRDYEKDPTLDFLRSYYYFVDGAFKYNNVESIHDSGQLSENGSIN